MKTRLVILLLIAFPFVIKAQAPQGYTLAWEENFSGNVLDAAIWNVETGDFGAYANSEQQFYTEDAIEVSQGTLKITAQWDQNDNRIESGRFNSRGKKIFGDGYYEARVRFRGTYHNSIFAAFWSMGYRHEDSTYAAHAFPSGSGWPSCGENDFMEWVGTDDDDHPNDSLYSPFGTCHYNPTPENAGSEWPHNWAYDTNFGPAGILNPTEWHTVGAKIEAGQCTYYLNGEPYAVYDLSPQSELLEDRFLICNMAIGGHLADDYLPENTLPATIMEWDYIHFYVKK
ncbi:MAG: glycoside hydrolase family 16 protein [Bacteroidota bacterium]